MSEDGLLVAPEQFHQFVVLAPQTQMIKTLHTELRRAHQTAFADFEGRFLPKSVLAASSRSGTLLLLVQLF